jgi:Icc-related predicted phosphoesterase
MVTAGAYTEGFFDEKKTRKYKKENKKETSQIMKYNKKRVDILFAHYPPFGFFDIVKYKGENPMKGKHIGFKGYTKFIKKNQPKLFICGHMHEYQGIKKLGKTLIIATGAARDGKAAIIEIEKERIKSIKFIK